MRRHDASKCENFIKTPLTGIAWDRRERAGISSSSSFLNYVLKGGKKRKEIRDDCLNWSIVILY